MAKLPRNRDPIVTLLISVRLGSLRHRVRRRLVVIAGAVVQVWQAVCGELGEPRFLIRNDPVRGVCLDLDCRLVSYRRLDRCGAVSQSVFCEGEPRNRSHSHWSWRPTRGS